MGPLPLVDGRGSMSFAQRVVNWQRSHGRNHLPWQQTRDPYRVWLSEIMLQQTQVATVLEYYQRFLARFPDVFALAGADLDEVMGLWSGLGYYSRARNLHRCAQQVVAEHGGAFPSSAGLLATLPGIGRSTAGAIAAFCFSERVPILDANVRRVLTRVLGFEHDLAVPRNERLLWEHAHALLPSADLDDSMPRYTQGLMDLGATVCVPRAPRCEQCPVANGCVARQQGSAQRFPVKTRKLARRAESWWLLVLRSANGRVWLERRASPGIWAGMHCVPVFGDETSLNDAVERYAGSANVACDPLAPFVHVLTHRDLHLHPMVCSVDEELAPLAQGAWLGPQEWDAVGIPAPIRKLLETTRPQLW